MLSETVSLVYDITGCTQWCDGALQYMNLYVLNDFQILYIFLSPLSLRCTSWESIDRPSISSILCDLAPLLSSCSSQQNIIGSGFDHTDSLGHVMIEFELDDDEDIDLMRFLQVRQFIIYCYINTYLSISSL